LRIGRPEHPKFATNGLNAAQLLDIFAAGTKTNIASGALLNSIPGRININTASTNVLRALAAGVTHTNDQALQPGGDTFVPSTQMVEAFINSVSTFRSSQPFHSSSQLASLATTPNKSEWPTNAIFGNPKLVGNSIKWNDAAAEEWFAKVYPLATVRSRNFLVYSVGQTIPPVSGKPGSTVVQVRQISLKAERDPNNDSVTNSIPLLISSWQL
jgi:hypothetical protein